MEINEKTIHFLSLCNMSSDTYLEMTEQEENPEKKLSSKETTKMSVFLYVTFKKLAHSPVNLENE